MTRLVSRDAPLRVVVPERYSPGRMVRQTRALVFQTVKVLALGAVFSSLGALACGGTPRELPSWSSEDVFVSSASVSELRAQSGVILLANPGTCALSVSHLARLAKAASAVGVPVRILFFGVENSPLVLDRLVADLQVESPARVVSVGVARAHFGVPVGGLPTVIVVRRGEIAARVFGVAALNAGDWLDALMGLSTEDAEG